MSESTITSKGQTTVPADVRVKNKSALDIVGRLKPADGKPVSVEDMNPWR